MLVYEKVLMKRGNGKYIAAVLETTILETLDRAPNYNLIVEKECDNHEEAVSWLDDEVARLIAGNRS